MAKLSLIKNRIKSISSTLKITKTMDMMAKSQTAKMLVVEQGMRPYIQKLNRIVEELALADKEHLHELQIEKSKIKSVLLFVITSTRGLCGSYNSHVYDIAMERIKHHKDANREVLLHVIGKKGASYFSEHGIKVSRHYDRIDENVTFDDCETIVNRFMHDYVADNISRVEVIFTRYYTRVVHIPKIHGLIPIVNDDDEVEGGRKRKLNNYVVEPDRDEVLKEIVPLAIKTSLYFMIKNSFLSENAERAIAMRNATDNATKLLDDLRKKANKARQENITNELLDIIGGSESLKNQ